MKTRNKWLALLLGAVMTVGMLSGCAGTKEDTKQSSTVKESVQNTETAKEETATQDSQEENSVRISDEVLTYTVAGPYLAASMDWNNTVQFKEYENRLGIKLDATSYDSDTWKSKMTLLIASDELPDIMVNAGMDRLDLAKYGKEGYFLDISQYLDVMPNLSAYLEKYPEYARHLTMDDGAIYGLEPLNTFTQSTKSVGIYISQTWLDNLGLQQPKSVDDLYTVLKAFKEQDANGNGKTDDEIPMMITFNGRYYPELPILWAYGIPSRKADIHESVDENGRVILWNTTDNYKEYLRFMHKLYAEKLINEDAFVLTDAEAKELVKTGIAGISCEGVIDVSGTNDGDYDHQKWAGVTGLTSEYNDKSIMVISSTISGSNFSIMVNADVENPEAVCSFLDYMYTEEGAISAMNGYEGLTFDLKDVEGFQVIDHSKYAEAAGLTSSEEYRQKIAVAAGAFSLLKINKYTIYDMLENIDKNLLMQGDCLKLATGNAMREMMWRDAKQAGVTILDQFPTLYYTEEESTQMSTLKTDITNYVKTVKVQFITGELDIDKDWDSYLNEMNKMGADRFLEIEQAAYDRRSK